MDGGLQQRCSLGFRRAQGAARRRLLIHGLVAWLALLGLILLIWLAVLGGFDPPRSVRWGLILSGGGLLAAAALGTSRRAFGVLRSRAALAGHCDRAAALPDTLAAAEEALRRPDRWPTNTPVRRVLVDRLLRRSANLLDDLDLPRLLPVWRPATVYSLLIAVLLAAGGLDHLAPEVLERGWRALRRPWRSAAAADGSLRLAPGPTRVTAGFDLIVAALDLSGGLEPVECEVRAGSGLWRRQPAEPVFVPGRAPGEPAPYERWETSLRQVTEDLVYRFRRGRRVSEARELIIRHPPLLLELAAVIEPPAYTGLPAQQFTRLPAFVEVPQGGRIELAGRASTRLESAAIVTDQGDTLELQVVADALQGTLAISEPLRWRTVLQDDRGLTGQSDLRYECSVVPDRVPTARLLQSGGSAEQLSLTPNVELQATAADDYGLSAVDLQLRRGWTRRPPPSDSPAEERTGINAQAPWQSLPLLAASGQTLAGRREDAIDLGPLSLTIVPRPTLAAEIALDIVLATGNLSLVPGDVIELRLEARDNREPGPPGVGHSSILRLQVPSSLDLLRAGELAQADRRGELAQMQRRSATLSDELERLRRELLKNPVPQWDRRQLLQATVERQQELQAELSRLAETIRQDLEALGQQHLLSPELMARMDTLADLLAETRADGLPELLARMRESLARMSARELSAAMSDLQRNQVDLLRRLETAKAMMRDLTRQQQMEGLTELAAELIRKQHELAEQQGSADDLARRQEALADELADLQERLQEALDELSAGDGTDSGAAAEAMREALAEALRQLADKQTRQTMREAGRNLPLLADEAKEQMQQALSDLAGLYRVFLRSQMAMQMAMQMQQGQQMRNIAADLLALSERQERLGLDLPSSLRDVRSEDLARRQHLILQGTIGLHERLQGTAAAAPRQVLAMLEKLDALIQSVGSTLNQIQEGRVQAARQGADGSLAGMNELVIQLLTQAQVSCQGGGSCDAQPQMSQQLQQLAQQQADLNALAEQLHRQQGRFSQEMRAAMQRLQQDQGELAGSARALADEQQQQQQRQPESGRLLGDLERLARDMELVADELAGGLITAETLRRQDRILSRLLDMHNASRQRDWTLRRESRTAVETLTRQPGAAQPPEEAALLLEARRWRAIEQAPPAYRDLVREYFREIQRLHETIGRGSDGLPPPERELP